MVTLNPKNSQALLSLNSISLHVKNVFNAFTYPSNLCEFFHLLTSLFKVSSESSFKPLIALLFCVVLLFAITLVRDSHSWSSGDFSNLRFLLVALCGVVVGDGDLGPSNTLLLSSELRSPGGPEGASVVLVVSSSPWWDPVTAES